MLDNGADKVEVGDSVSRGNVELLIVTVIWGINSIAIKDALGEFLPLQFNVIRLGLATCVLFAIMFFSKSTKVPRRKDWPLVLITGFLGNTFYQFMFIKGISLSTATNTSFILATMPATTAVLSHFLGKQRLTVKMWFGVLLTLLGVSFIVTGGSAQVSQGFPGKLFSSDSALGDLITLSGTLGWCLYTIFSADLVKSLNPISATTWTMLSGVIFLIPLSLQQLNSGNWSEISPLAWLELCFSAVFAIAISYILWNRGIRDSGPAKTAIFGNLTPVWTGVFGWLLLHEAWNMSKFIGASVILLGVSLVRFSTSRDKKPGFKRQRSLGKPEL